MKTWLKYLLLSLIVSTSSLSFAQEDLEEHKKPARESNKKIKKVKKRGQKLKFRNMDLNDNHEISLKEYIEFRKQDLEKEFDKHDRDQDGVISRKEFHHMQKAMRKKRKTRR